LLKVGDNRKVSFEEAVDLVRRTVTLPQIAASWFSFQNIDSIHKAFESNFQINFRGLIKQRRRVSRRLPVLSNALEELISFRHGIVHRFEKDSTLTRTRLLELIALAKTIIELMSSEIERREGAKLGPG